MADEKTLLTVFDLSRLQTSPDDAGYILLKRQTPDEAVCYRVALSKQAFTGKIAMEDCLLRSSLKDPLLRFTFIDGTIIELSDFDLMNAEQPYEVIKFKKGDRLISSRITPNKTGAILGFVEYPTNSIWVVMRLLERKKS